MIFATYSCPLCLANLEKVEEQDKVIYVCYKQRVRARNWLDTGVVDYPHYAYRIPLKEDGSLIEERAEVSMLLPPYLLGHYNQTKQTLIYAISEHKLQQLIVTVPLLEKNYTDSKKILETLKTLVIFS